MPPLIYKLRLDKTNRRRKQYYNEEKYVRKKKEHNRIFI